MRQHTAASLFTALYAVLREEGYLAALREPRDLEDVRVGDIVQVAGAFIGNPLQQVLSFFAQVLPYILLAPGDEDDQEFRPDAGLDTGPGHSREALEQGDTPTVGESRALAEQKRAEAEQARRSGNPAKQALADGFESEAEELDQQAQTAAGLEELQQLGSSVDEQTANFGIRMMAQMAQDL